MHPHVFKMLHWGVEAKVLDVKGHVASPGGGCDTVDVEFEGGDTASFGAHIVGVKNEVASHG